MKQLILLLLFALPAYAQSLDAGSVPRAGVHDLSIKTGSNLNWNPAVLAQPRLFHWSLELPSLSAATSNNTFSVNFWNDHLAGDRFFTSADKSAILDRIPDDGWQADAQASVPLLGFTYNRFGFHATVEASGHATAPRDLVQLALWGNTIGVPYSLSDLSGDAQVFADYSAGFGYQFEQTWVPALYFGAGFHFYHGFFLSKVERSEASVITTDSAIVGSGVIHIVQSNSGDGVGFDLGGMAVLSDHLQVGLALRQIGARMTWDVDENHQLTFYTDSSGIQPDSINNDDAIKRAFHSEDFTYSGGAVETVLPAIIQMNGRYALHPQWSLLGDISIRTSQSSKGPAGADFGAATEYSPLRWLLVQGGLSGGNLWGLRTGLGMGLRFQRYEMDFGGAWNGGFLNSARGVSFGITHRLQF